MNITQVLPIMAASKKTGDVVLMRGLHGIGKSAITVQYADQYNLGLEILILSLMEQGDLIGIPNITNNTTTWAAPDWLNNLRDKAWPKRFNFEDLEFKDKNFEEEVNKHSKNAILRENLNKLYNEFYNVNLIEPVLTKQDNVSCRLSKETVLFVDEYSRAGADIHNSTMQLILDKRLHNHVLPYVNGVQTQIIAADNPADGDYHVTELDPAKLDRFLIIDVEVDAKAWLAWARENEVNSIVRDFIMNNLTKIHYVPEDQSQTGATPRSWTMLGKFVNLFETIPEESIFPIIRGKVGSSLGAQFYTYYNEYNKNVSIEDIQKIIDQEFFKQGDNIDLEKIGKVVKELTKEMEGVTKMEYAEELFSAIKTEINDAKGVENVVHVLGFLYSLDLEILTSLLKEWKNNEKEAFYGLMKLDPKKALALKIKSKVQK